MAGMVTQAPWPTPREELRLYPGPPGMGGAPSWTLHDPAAQRFFQLGWLEVEILNRWRLGSPQGIADAIRAETTLAAGPAAVEKVHAFLIANNLIAAPLPEDTRRLRDAAARRRPLLARIVKNYLFIRIPLVRPDSFLDRTLPNARWLFSSRAMAAFGVFALLGLYLISRQWSQFRDSFAGLLSFQGGLMAAAALGLSKAVHELGHAYAAKTMGLRVPSMGVALMCFAPVLWTDTTEAWKLRDRRKRLFVGASGVLPELYLAALASLAWPVLPPGPAKTAAFIVAGSAWILTLMVNINPCMRYDGYYLLSDHWNVPGLQARSFALAKWRLREWLFGLGQPPPEYFPPRDRFKLVVYAFVTWIYRLFLFLGIALLVYHLFFKALGAALMLVELVFFIALPVGVEFMHWFKLRKRFRPNLRLVRAAILFAALFAFFVLPWHGGVSGAGLMFSERQSVFFAPMGAMLDETGAANGDAVREGDLLFRLRSPDLDARIDIAGRRLAAQRLKLSMASLDARIRAELVADWQELERLAEDLGGMLAMRDSLEIRAPFPGTVADVPAWMDAGGWVGAREGLGMLVGGGSLVAAYVSEADWSRIRTGGGGMFYGAGVDWDPLPLEILAIDSQAVAEIPYPELASPLGGPLAAHKDATGKYIPEHAVYRILCRVAAADSPGRFITGRVSLEAERRSLLQLVWNNFIGILVRESSW